MTTVLIGIGIYALFSYLGEELEGFGVGRSIFLSVRIATSFVAVGLIMGWDQWYFGFAALGISRICSRLDNYVTTVARSLSQQRRR